MEKKYLNELKTAEEFFEVAKKNLDLSLKTSANRLYFAFEKAIIAYLIFKSINVQKNHQKIWELSAKLLGEEYYSLFRVLYDLRMQADYGNVSIFADLSVKTVKENISKVEFLVKKIKLLMKEEEKVKEHEYEEEEHK